MCKKVEVASVEEGQENVENENEKSEKYENGKNEKSVVIELSEKRLSWRLATKTPE